MLVRMTHTAEGGDIVPISGGDAISLATELSRECWSLSGAKHPTYTRSCIPFRVLSREHR